MEWKTSCLAACLAGVAVLVLVPMVWSGGAAGVTVRETADGFVAEGVDWVVIPVHAEEGEPARGEIVVTDESPPNTVFEAHVSLDDEWNVLGHWTRISDSVGESVVVRFRDRLGGTHEVSTPNPEGNKSTYQAKAGWDRLGDEDGSLVGYEVVLTSADAATINVSASDGWIGNHTEGADGVALRRASDFDEVRFHAKAGELGPGMTLDAREQVDVNDTLVAVTDLTPGHGKAGWWGPGDRGMKCSSLLDTGCDHRLAITGPAGVYDFVVDRHVQTVKPYLVNKEPWALAGDVVQPD